eukprot:TRINITY_DN2740_c0_g1_i2.p1 TRINITY_DN2740_c0_g1~~TRINITY_DN2740_c0_g1_i2.p1  ORF type:complete len:368 (-),score=112.60 TRINITY_DN2740_c0_g1_i2:468-1571(-)
MRRAKIKVPGSSGNVGSGFDALSLALGVYLTVDISITPSPSHDLLIKYSGVNEALISMEKEVNLITRTMYHVVQQCNGILPQAKIQLNVNNEIPLSKGMGSSASAVIAGCILANELCNLNLTKNQIMKYAMEIENHPDNLAAALFGGFVVSSVDSVSGECFFVNTPVSSNIKAVVVMPDIAKQSTAAMRSVLPEAYTRGDIVFNLQRACLLTSLFFKSELTTTDKTTMAKMFATAMQDKIHQPYRQALMPGMGSILALSQNILDIPSLFGVCISGAGPSVLALADSREDHVSLISRLQISDFGVSVMFEGEDDAMRKTSGTPAFIAPEICMEFVPFMAPTLLGIFESIIFPEYPRFFHSSHHNITTK